MINNQHDLLVSSPNGGGVYLVRHGHVYKLDNLSTTGLHVRGKMALRGVQPSKLAIFNSQSIGMYSDQIGFEDIHDVFMDDDDAVYIIGTSKNEIVKLDKYWREMHRWVFPGEHDALHINCITKWRGRIIFSAFGEFKIHRDYKGKTKDAGFIQDLMSGEKIITGLSQPHTLVVYGDNLLLMNSETREIFEYDFSCQLIRRKVFDGYTRGMCVSQEIIYVGLSCSRNIDDPRVDNAFVVAIDAHTWEELWRIGLPAAEVYDICAVEGRDLSDILLGFINHISQRCEQGMVDYDRASVELSMKQVELDMVLVEKQRILAEYEQVVADRDQLLVEYKARIESCDGMKAIIAERDAHLEKLYLSTSWKVSAPLRSLKKSVLGFRSSMEAWVRSAYHATPISMATKLRIKNILFGIFGGMLKHTASYRAWLDFNSGLGVGRDYGYLPTIEASKYNLPKPVVSFVMPVYDRTDVLAEAIESVLNQETNHPIELIIVTDGSPSETLKVIRKYEADERVRVFNYKDNTGNAVRGRNKGIKEAVGEYICFLDSDDVAPKNRVEVSLSNISGYDVIYGAWRILSAGTRSVVGIKDGEIIYSSSFTLEQILKNNYICLSTVMARRSSLLAVGGLKSAQKYREDHELWARLAYFGFRFRVVNEVLAIYRLHANNNELNFIDDDAKWKNALLGEYKNKSRLPIKIAFIVPGMGISGGVAVILNHANRLLSLSYDVLLISQDNHVDAGWFPNNMVPIYKLADCDRKYFENIDLLVATGWQTVGVLNSLNGWRKAYFVQSDERRFVEDVTVRQIIANTYLTPVHYFTEALWIKRWLKEEFGHDAGYVPNGLDCGIFNSDNPLKPKGKKLRVLIEGPISIPYKGMRDAYAAISGLDCDIWIISSSGTPPSDWVYDAFFAGVPMSQMGRIYASCDIFLKMSRVEGFFGPPMEAMACGCAVVVGKVTGYDEYIKHNHNALVVEQGDVQAARYAVKSLMDDEVLRKQLVAAGFETIKHWSWEESTRYMVDFIAQLGFEGKAT